MKIIKLEEIDSTNNFAKDFLLKNNPSEDIIIFTKSQTKGRGTGQNSWYCEKENSLIFSLITFPNINASDFFKLNIIISLSIVKYLETKGISAKVKWTNDIYVGDKKICGILIENIIELGIITKSIIGIGLNVNGLSFPDNLPNPISMQQITDENYILEGELLQLFKILNDDLKHNLGLNFDDLKIFYLQKMFRYNEFHWFRNTKTDKIFEGKIINIEEFGKIIILNIQNQTQSFDFKEIEFLI